MDFGDAAVIAGDQAVEDFGQPDPRAAVDSAHDPEVDHRDAPVGQREEISLVKVGVEEAVDDRLPQEGADQGCRERLAVVPGRNQRVAVVELDPVEPFERQDPARGSPPVDLRHMEVGLGDHILAQLRRGGGFALQVELAHGPLAEMGDDQPRPQPRSFTAGIFDMSRGPFIGFQRFGEFLLDAGPQNLDGDFAAFGGDRTVDLGDRGGADRLGVELAEQLVERGLERGFDRLLDRREGGGGRSSWRRERFSAARAPTRSGRVDSACPSLIAAGPISWSAFA